MSAVAAKSILSEIDPMTKDFTRLGINSDSQRPQNSPNATPQSSSAAKTNTAFVTQRGHHSKSESVEMLRAEFEAAAAQQKNENSHLISAQTDSKTMIKQSASTTNKSKTTSPCIPSHIYDDASTNSNGSHRQMSLSSSNSTPSPLNGLVTLTRSTIAANTNSNSVSLRLSSGANSNAIPPSSRPTSANTNQSLGVRPHAMVSNTSSAKSPHNASSSAAAIVGAPVWVARWVDYSNKYGIGYLLNTGQAGVYFNDASKMWHQPQDSKLTYSERRTNTKQSSNKGTTPTTASTTTSHHEICDYEKSNVPASLSKKVLLLKHFTNYLAPANQAQHEIQSSEVFE
jgi:hypothetical protein